MKSVLHVKGMGGILIPYKGYIEVNLTILYLHHYNKDVLFFIVANHRYGDTVPV